MVNYLFDNDGRFQPAIVIKKGSVAMGTMKDVQDNRNYIRARAWLFYMMVTGNRHELIHEFHVQEVMSLVDNEASEHRRKVTLEALRTTKKAVAEMEKMLAEFVEYHKELQRRIDAFPVEEVLACTPDYPRSFLIPDGSEEGGE